jgi:hypothetical protein
MATKEQFEELKSSNKTILETLATMNASLQSVVSMKTDVENLKVNMTDITAQLKKQEEDTAAGFDAVNRRVDEIQATVAAAPPQGQQAPVVLKASMKDVLPRAVMRLDQLYDEASQLDGTVIVGKLPSAPAERYSEAVVRDVVAQLSGSHTSITPRGDKGVYAISFKAVARSTPGVRARSFLSKLPGVHASRLMWAQLDKPRELREHDSRARRFGRQFKARVVAPSATTDKPPVFFSIVKGFLVVNESVIGPINLIPDEDHWPELSEMVLTLIKNPRRPQLSHSKPLLAQMTKPIAELLYEAFVSIPEEFPDPCAENADESDLLDLEFDEDLVDQTPPPPVFEPNIDWLAPLDRPAPLYRQSSSTQAQALKGSANKSVR